MNSYYAFRGAISYYGRLLDSTELHDGEIAGRLSAEETDLAGKEPPHVRLVNLPTFDAGNDMILTPQQGLRVDSKAVETFLKKYGPLYLGATELAADQDAAVNAYLKKGGSSSPSAWFEHEVPGWLETEVPPKWEQPPLDKLEPPPDLEYPQNIFRLKLSEFACAQHLLRRAWTGEGSAVHNVGEEIRGLNVRRFDPRKGMVLGTASLWRFICLLFLLDHLEGKAGFCPNPDCLAPYFVRRRKGQQYCSHGCAVLISVHRFRAREKRHSKRSA